MQTPQTRPAKPNAPSLQALGWQQDFAADVSAEELAALPPVRITEVHRTMQRVMGNGIDRLIGAVSGATVGDWLLYEASDPKISRLLPRKSLIKRRAPGRDVQVQLIAANIDTLFIVTSCNADFNLARLERYIALAFDADVTPVILLTKADLCADATPFITAASAISDRVAVLAIDAHHDDPRVKLAQWCRDDLTVAFIGSSGVGKSTLTNALVGNEEIETAEVRDSDAKGRHTTTRRQLHVVPGLCVVLDTPGMRELQLTDAAAGIDDVFADLRDLAAQCRFRDCKHQVEPGCAILAAIDAGTTDAGRLARWQKLIAEEAANVANVALVARRRSKAPASTKMQQKKR